MNLKINNEKHSLPAPLSLKELLATLSMGEKKGIAVAVNDSIVIRDAWERHTLQENDSITIIQATQGG
ncbi:MAG TPA: sulfur carrier protein ThiS [Bacteroidia bacterium]|jgi:sulfur carrier protein|nr:sulfur carrier protein ThiS [Bacteroidia bacterium]